MEKKNSNAVVPAGEPRPADRIERFQALQAGQYWRARHQIEEEGIDKDMVLLIQSIRWVDDKPHTIILRAHPTKIGEYFEARRKNADGTVTTHYETYDEHRFLLNDFLEAFEFEPDHQQVRARELAQIQNKVAELQAELIEAQANPAKLALIVEEGLKELAEEEEEGHSRKGRKGKKDKTTRSNTLPIAPNEAVALATGPVVKAIDAGLSEAGIEQIKTAAKREHQIATVKAKWISAKTEEIAETIQAMTPFYQEQAAAALAQTEDVRVYVDKLVQGIESLDLYVGKGVKVETLREGKSAPREEPLTFMQRKLIMEEELAVWADVNESFDFTREKIFFAKLLENESLVNQIFPTPRCVVVMATTRRSLDYGNPYTSAAMNQLNHHVFLLVRDGENLHRVYSPVESHLGTARLFPSKNEQDRIFSGLDGSQIKFEDVAYTDKLAEHERHALHYKRFLLLACGLDHRLKLFGEFYEGPPSMKFVSLEFQEQYCRFLHDDPSAGTLIGEARPPVHKWIAEKNAYLRSGSRVLCNWRQLMNPKTAPAACKAHAGRSYGRGFDWRYQPENPFDIVIAYRDGEDLFVDIEVSGETRRFETRKFKCKVNLSVFKNGDWEYSDLPMLCLDAVEPEDVHYYIHSREARSDHLSYIRFFKRALGFITAERAAEAPTRDRLVKSLEEGRIASGKQAREIVSQAVVAWRAANRGKALPRIEDGETSAAWKSLLDQMYSLARSGEATVREVETLLVSKGYEPLRLILDGSARMKVYAAPAKDERDDRLTPHSWVHCITLGRSKTKLSERSRRWALLPASAASETTLHEWKAAKRWVFDQVPFGAFETKQARFAEAMAFESRLSHYTGELSVEAWEELYSAWATTRAKFRDKSRLVVNPELVIPIGLVYSKAYKRLRYLCVGFRNLHTLLYAKAPNEECAARVRERFVGVYAHKDSAKERFESAIGKSEWSLVELALKAPIREDGIMHPDYTHWAQAQPKADPRLGTWIENWKREHAKDAEVWFAPGIFDESGACTLDERLGIRVPEDFSPRVVTEIVLTEDDDQTMPKYTHWYDVEAFDEVTEREESYPFRASRRERVPKEYAYRSSQQYEMSPAAAEAYLKRLAAETGLKIVPARELNDAPKAPKGVERWYVVPTPKK